jgi:AcrR family transcriptional regulator
MKQAVKGGRPRGRPRSEHRKQAILEAAQALLEEGGPGAVTMEAVAARAGVGKPTVYRWWPDRHAVAMAALMAKETHERERSSHSSALSSLREQLHAIARRFATGTGRHVTSMIASADSESELGRAFRNHFVLARRTEGKAWLERAMLDGDLRPELDLEVALDLLYGPLFFRLLMGHAPLDQAFVDRVLDDALRGIAASPKRASKREPAR